MHAYFIRALTISVTLLGISRLPCQNPVPIICALTPYGSPCGPRLEGTDAIVGGNHRIRLQVRSATPNAPLALALGAQTASLPLPSSPCLLLVQPFAFASLNADGAGNAELTIPIAGAAVGRFYSQALDWATGQILASNGLRVQCFGRMQITSVTPTAGAEGTLITIRGSGFDPNPRNNCVWIGQITTAEVVSAAPNRLVARVQAIPAPGEGDVCVLRGTSVELPAGPMTLAGQQVDVERATFMTARAQPANAGIRFQLPNASPNTTPAVPTANGLLLRVPPATAARAVLEFHLELSDGSWFDVYFVVRNTIWTPSAVARVAASYIRTHVPGLTAVAGSSSLLVRGQDPLRSGLGYMQGQQ